MEFKDYYEIMGVPRDASQDEIKRAYRKLARKYHPDVSKAEDAEARFKEVGEAYAVLRDPEKRAAYDQLGSNYKAGQEFRPPPDWDAGFEFSGGPFRGGGGTYTTGDFGGAEFSDFFENLFGGGFRPAGGGGRQGFKARGEDTHAKIVIDVEDAYRGATRAVALKHSELGDDGRPRLRERTLNVKIPKGVRPGQQIRLAGQGAPGIGGGDAGDLYLEIAFRDNARYSVDGRDVYVTLPVAPWEAALGAKVTTATPTGDIELAVPAGSQQGRKLRLKGRGLPGKTPGDLYAVLQIVLPPADTDAAKDAWRQLAGQFRFDPRRGTGGAS